MSVSEGTCTGAGAFRSQASAAVEPECQVIVSCLVCALGTELRPEESALQPPSCVSSSLVTATPMLTLVMEL